MEYRFREVEVTLRITLNIHANLYQGIGYKTNNLHITCRLRVFVYENNLKSNFIDRSSLVSLNAVTCKFFVVNRIPGFHQLLQPKVFS